MARASRGWGRGTGTLLFQTAGASSDATSGSPLRGTDSLGETLGLPSTHAKHHHATCVRTGSCRGPDSRPRSAGTPSCGCRNTAGAPGPTLTPPPCSLRGVPLPRNRDPPRCTRRGVANELMNPLASACVLIVDLYAVLRWSRSSYPERAEGDETSQFPSRTWRSMKL